ncbi:Macrolide export protein MacA [Gimesia alba]|uniref:Macrolide export protein MacA n=1 Tax=Gimesia alba TaxID=2527973 RepID=A0A517RCT0_9PLAN|nr:HlyD family efflux transporter periplasmic adaptor subunit [Gimesia alba]QDT41653.1 Macrolide export protein MacA [Gimesia alba]
MKKWSRRISLLVVLLILSGLLAYGFWPVPVQVDLVQADQGAFLVTVNEDGKTRIREKYIVSAPVSGNLFRIELQEGDPIQADQTVLARIEPSDPILLDARAEAEAAARVRAAEATVKQAEAALHRNKEALELAEHDYQRALKLLQMKTITRSEFDEYEHHQGMAKADVDSAGFALAVANFELELAKAALISTRPTSGGKNSSRTLTMTSPINGQVLRVLHENAGVVTPGTPLLEFGDPHDLELEIDVLSTDAVKIHPGAKIFIEHWGGAGELEATVRLVEPSAFLKVSALGVEEQRVNIIADFSSPFEKRKTLGDGYRIEARIVVSEAMDVVKVPSGTLFREGRGWHVFLVEEGYAKLQPVEIGMSNGLETEITQGVTAGDLLILHPTDEIEDGTPVVGK